MHFTLQFNCYDCNDALRALSHLLVCLLSLNQIEIYTFESFAIWFDLVWIQTAHNSRYQEATTLCVKGV